MTATTEFDIVKIKDEFNNFLRVKLNPDDPLIRVITQTKSFAGAFPLAKFSLSSNLSYVGSVFVNRIEKYFGTHWTIGWRGTDIGKIIMKYPPTFRERLVVKYGITTGNGNFVDPELPRTDSGIHDYPKVGFKTTVRSDLASLGGSDNIAVKNDILFQIRIVSTDTKEIDDLIDKIRGYVTEYLMNFYYWNHIKPESITEYDDFDDNTAQNHSKTLEFIVPSKYDIITYSSKSLGTGD